MICYVITLYKSLVITVKYFMKYLRISLIMIAISAFSLATFLSFHSETEKEISIKITPYQELHTDG